jgi:subtilisin family serine protease
MSTALRALPAIAVAALLFLPAVEPAAPGRISEGLEAGLRAGHAADRHLVWVFFRDKGAQARGASARLPITPRALSRRSLRAAQPGAGAIDLPLDRGYVDAVARTVIRIRQESRWFNAVSVEATEAQVRALEALPFVARLDVVRRYRRGPSEKVTDLPAPARASSAVDRPRALVLDYGTSLGQLRQIGVPEVHAAGLHGEGVIIAVLDAGFNNLAHEVFAPMTILARRDFVNGDLDVGDGGDQGEGSHGTATLSVLGGFKEGQLIGPAFAAGFILAKTENTFSETPVEEDNWAAAAEWAEALGADVISSSLGYLEYDSPFTSYSFTDMNGDTAISTKAANLAASLGVVVVNSAGNSGLDPAHNTLGAPADGRGVIAAGAVDPFGFRAFFSSVGPTADGRIKPDVAAQGVSVKVASATSPSLYGLAAGTSFSCPLTAGAVALVLQAHPAYTPQQVAEALRGTASKASAPDNLLGYGIVNALAAIGSRPPTPTPTPDPPDNDPPDAAPGHPGHHHGH